MERTIGNWGLFWSRFGLLKVREVEMYPDLDKAGSLRENFVSCLNAPIGRGGLRGGDPETAAAPGQTQARASIAWRAPRAERGERCDAQE